MKKSNFIIATLLVAVAASVAFVSCKKESQDELLNNTQPIKTFTVPQIDDMNAYLKDFRHRMEESQNNKSAEFFSLEEAAWHLACLANVDFCRVNVEYDDFLFDTIEMQVNITNGIMPMTDLYMAYEQMCTEIQQFKKSFNRPDQNLYFIKVSISIDGIAKIALMTSYSVNSKDLYDHPWYFSDVYEAIDVCDEYFSQDSTYLWNGAGASELQYVLNHINAGGPFIMCYTPTRDYTFDYTNTHDPYGTGYYYINDSRVFAKRYNHSSPYYIFDNWEMCYFLDSYLGLGYDYVNDNLYTNESPICWIITSITYHNNSNINNPYYYYHKLKVEFGQPYIPSDPPTPSDQ